MRDISSIVCVVDPTTRTQDAVSRAQWLAECTGAKLELLICDYDEYLSGTRFHDSPAFQQARGKLLAAHQQHLDDLAGPLRKLGLSVTTKVIWHWPLHEAIVTHAVDTGASLIFKDTHHHSAIDRTVFSNTDWNLIRLSPVPVWLVKSVEMPLEPKIVAAVDPLNKHDKPAALDDRILEVALTLARHVGGQVHAVHIFDPDIAIAAASANNYVPVSLPLDDIEILERERHEQRLDAVVRSHGLPKQNTHLISGAPHTELPDFADTFGASLVVMGVVARNPIKRLLIGATAERALERLRCDLLTVKPEYFSPGA